jgi:dTDP-4-amino-4,6-dideoxygalactose transaminase
LGRYNTTSFLPRKYLGALGDGGAITTENTDFAEKVKILRNYESEKKYQKIVIDINSLLDEIRNVFLKIKIRKP